MRTSDFNNISMNGRMAYLILCVEKYLLAKYPDQDWRRFAQLMWHATSDYWDEWDNTFMEIIPEYLYEFKTYEESDFEYLSEDDYNYYAVLFKDMPEDFNQLLLKMHELQKVYCYSTIPGCGVEASELLIDACEILENNKIQTPDISKVSFSSFSEKNGWGEEFSGEDLSILL